MGFPNIWYAWHFQPPAVAEAGYRVVAPDLRGYNLSDMPKDIGQYRLALQNGVKNFPGSWGKER